jgi:hypothetical protein
MHAVLETGLVAGETIELFGQFWVVEGVEIGCGGGVELRFHAADTVQIPGGGDDLLEQNFLESALRPDIGLELVV